MTVIAAKKTEKGIQFASDSISTSGSLRCPDPAFLKGKLFEKNGMIIGGTGDSSENQLLSLFARNHRPVSTAVDDVIDFFVEFRDFGKQKDNGFETGNHYLMAFDGCLYRTYSGTFEVFELEDFDAIGAGEHYATAALALGHSPREAVELAIKLSVWCAGPIVEMEQIHARSRD